MWKIRIASVQQKDIVYVVCDRIEKHIESVGYHAIILNLMIA